MHCVQIESFVQTSAQNKKTLLFFIINDTKKQQILTFKRLKQQFFVLFLFEKWLKRLNDYQNSLWLIFKWRIYLLIAAALLQCDAKMRSSKRESSQSFLEHKAAFFSRPLGPLRPKSSIGNNRPLVL